MSDSHIENQMCLKVVQDGENKNNYFSFIFSIKKDNIYINRLEQDIEYGWEVPQATGISDSSLEGAKSSTELAFAKEKTSHDITLKGVIYTQLNKEDGAGVVAGGIESLVNLKLQAGKGVKWHLVGENGIHYKSWGKGQWYIKRIQQGSEYFVTGLNALKLEFTIVLKKYA